MADAEFTITVSTMPAAADDPAALTLASGTRAHAGGDGVDQVEFGFAAHRGHDGAAAVQERVGR